MGLCPWHGAIERLVLIERQARVVVLHEIPHTFSLEVLQQAMAIGGLTQGPDVGVKDKSFAWTYGHDFWGLWGFA